MEYRIVSANFDKPDAHKLSVYESLGGYKSLDKVFAMQPDAVIDYVKQSGLRGRGFELGDAAEGQGGCVIDRRIDGAILARRIAPQAGHHRPARRR